MGIVQRKYSKVRDAVRMRMRELVLFLLITHTIKPLLYVIY